MSKNITGPHEKIHLGIMTPLVTLIDGKDYTHKQAYKDILNFIVEDIQELAEHTPSNLLLNEIVNKYHSQRCIE